ncbi:alkene reductase [Subtercola sp. Z020]|uniref:alkene reductase n=1 Tax=Subtercola sp. Z020 TaxID=2080582 RepID=UPI000CE7DB31|nr:alkene reductase [Subtercola sp. Z020]PPF89510.1 alkene reductase [Subtercola sp. Z020]
MPDSLAPADLFAPAAFGALRLDNRLVMAPLTRMRSGAEGIPGPIVAEHYAQRASAGLIVSEGTYPSFAGHAFVGQPGLVTEEQLAGWRAVTDAVHANGGQIVAQVMHGGRATHEHISGHEVVAPSAIAIQAEVHTPEGKEPYPVPRALRDDELPGIVEEFVTGSRNAIAAGFDGVELHGANGYLLNEFLSESSNHREAPYGGSPENRARLVIEVVRAVVDAIGADRVGLRISPERNAQDVFDTPEDAEATYGYLIDQLAPLGLAFVSILHPDPSGELVQGLRTRFGGPFLVNSGFESITTRDEALAWMAAGHSDAVVVGRAFLANPDLPRRWRENTALNELVPATIYASGAEGYTDYPTLEQVG